MNLWNEKKLFFFSIKVKSFLFEEKNWKIKVKYRKIEIECMKIEKIVFPAHGNLCVFCAKSLTK